jgi:hypothetical protein
LKINHTDILDPTVASTLEIEIEISCRYILLKLISWFKTERKADQVKCTTWHVLRLQMKKTD